MRITAPSSGARVRLDEIDLAETRLYSAGDAHLVWQTLRRECPVFWQPQDNGPGFWAVTRWADVRRVLAEHETFTSERGTSISMLGAPDPSAGKMMQATDPPRHQQLRKQLGQPFSPHAVPVCTRRIRSFLDEAIDKAGEDSAWDIAQELARLPVVVAVMLLGLPDADVEPLLRLSYASLAPADPRYSEGSEKTTARLAHYKLAEYFTKHIAERRKNPSDDVISHMISIEIGEHRLTGAELLLNCVSLILGAVVTTSQAVNATLITLAEQHGGEGRWPPSMPVLTVVEEALRWSSPVIHFMRHARRDVEMHGRKIRSGDAVTAWLASANRDESIFEQPYALNFARSPNRHMAFGSGPHLCLGSHLARLMLREAFEKLRTRIESFELAGQPSHLVSTEIAGVVNLPIRLRLRPGTR